MRRIRNLVATSVALAAVAVAPASAYMNYSGFEPESRMSVLETISVFVLVPTAIYAAVWLLWWLVGSHAKSKPGSAPVKW